MSLINKALKQEQLRRSGGMQDGAAQMMASTVSGANRRNNQGPKILIAFIGLGLVLTLSITLFAVFGLGFLKSDIEVSDPSKKTLATSESTTPIEEAVENEENSTTMPDEPAATADDVINRLDLSPEELEALKSLIGDSESQGESIPNIDGENVISTDGNEAEQPAEPTQDLEILNYIEELVVQGARDAGDKSRLLMNGRVYRINDVIDHEKGLIFKEVSQGYVIFQDQNGVDYQKTL